MFLFQRLASDFYFFVTRLKEKTKGNKKGNYSLRNTGNASGWFMKIANHLICITYRTIEYLK
jgi:hypothetical protein